MEQNIITVSQVNEYIKFLLDRDEMLTNICVRGELSNYKIYPSGHHYFSLKSCSDPARSASASGRKTGCRSWSAAV